MYQIQNITNDANQTQTLTLYDGSILSMTMYFIPLQYGWFITSMTWGTFVLNGLRITVGPNILRQWQNQLTFGLGCACNTNPFREPTQQQDFSSNNFYLYILSSTEVQQYEQILMGSTIVPG
jgi:hypothetical protein